MASRDPDKAQDFAVQFGCEAVLGYENLLDRTDIDAVYMPLPTGLHDEWIPRCLDAGKHVLAEKSIANHPASAERMVARARARSLVLMEDYMFLYHRQIATVQRMLAQGEIGTLRVVRTSFGFPPLAKANFRYDEVIGGGALLDAAGYTVRSAHLFGGDDLQVKGAHLHRDPERGTSLWAPRCSTMRTGFRRKSLSDSIISTNAPASFGKHRANRHAACIYTQADAEPDGDFGTTGRAARVSDSAGRPLRRLSSGVLPSDHRGGSAEPL